MVNLTSSVRLGRMLSSGYFPPELPPTFTTRPFSEKARALYRAWPEQKLAHWRSVPELFSIPKKGHARRDLAIVSPINHYKLSRLIAHEWPAIRKHIRKSNLTEFIPEIDASGSRSIFPPNYIEIDRRRARVRAAYPRALKTDITAFYNSIYTHSIAWALHGKEWSKQHVNTTTLSQSLGGRLDKALRQCQDNQTHGIPTGPDTSRIIAEIVGVAVDQVLEGQTPHAKGIGWGLRYVDDYFIGIPPNESDASIAAKVANAMQVFGLEINERKTDVDVIGHNERPVWIRSLADFHFNRKREVESIRDFFDILLSSYECELDDAVLKYGVKQSRSFGISSQNVSYFIDRVLHVTRIAPSTLPAAVQSIIERVHNNRGVDVSYVAEYISSAVPSASQMGHDFEACWLLYLARGLSIKLRRSDLDPVFKSESSAVALVVMDMDKKGLIIRGVDETYWKNVAADQGLKGPMWLLSYEAAYKGWWRDGERTYVEEHPLFGPMLKRGVYFYDETRNVRSTFAEMVRMIRERIRNRRIFEEFESYF